MHLGLDAAAILVKQVLKCRFILPISLGRAPEKRVYAIQKRAEYLIRMHRYALAYDILARAIDIAGPGKKIIFFSHLMHLLIYSFV